MFHTTNQADKMQATGWYALGRNQKKSTRVRKHIVVDISGTQKNTEFGTTTDICLRNTRKTHNNNFKNPPI